MAIGCKNCGGHFTLDELQRRKPPPHPWPLTALGQRVQAENAATEPNPRICPNCGRFTLVG